MYPRMEMAAYHHASESAPPSPHHYNHHPHMTMQPIMMAGPQSHRMTPEPGMSSYHLEAIAQSNNTMRKVQTHNGNSRFKTELCRSWSTSGACRYGDKCQFAHGADELRPLQRHPKYKTELCRYVELACLLAMRTMNRNTYRRWPRHACTCSACSFLL
jgi:butyrate response factor 1